MGEIKLNKKTRFAKFMRGKGFYAALAVCVLGAGAAAWAAVSSTLQGVDSPQSSVSVGYSSQAEGSWGFPSLEEAGKAQPSVPVESSSSSSSRAPSGQESSSQASSAPQGQSSVPQEQSGAPGASSAPQETSSASPTAYLLPVSGAVSGTFSGQTLVRSVTMGDWRTHNGVDIAAAAGTPVKAAADGVVSNVEEDGLWGTVVHILHADGNTSVYAALAEVLTVSLGEQVTAGDVIGAVGNSAPAESAEGPHLHFAMQSGGEWVDPALYLSLPAAME